MHFLNFQKNSSILDFFRFFTPLRIVNAQYATTCSLISADRVGDLNVQRCKGICRQIFTRIYFQLFRFLFYCGFFKGVCRQIFTRVLYKNIFCIQIYFFYFSDFYWEFFKRVCRQIFIQDL
jgi:hypothetical protein